MFERFTNRARKVLVLAQEEARSLEHDVIGTEHVLLGLVEEAEGVAGQVLAAAGLEVDGLRAQIRERGAPTAAKVPERPPFSPTAKKVLELSLREALALGHNYIGTEHLLLALAREDDGLASELLEKHGLSSPRIREHVLTKLQGFAVEKDRPKRWWSRPRTEGASPTAPSNDHTPAVDSIIRTSEALAQRTGEPVGSHHLVAAVMDDPDSLAARTLTSFGITKEALMERFDEIGIEGTTDEVPKQEPFDVAATQDEVTIRIKDATLAEKVRRGELTVTFTERSA